MQDLQILQQEYAGALATFLSSQENREMREQ